MRPSRTWIAPVIATVAVISLSATGGAVAAGMITGSQIKNGTVTTKDVQNGSLTSKDIAKASLRSGDFSRRATQELKGAAGPRGPRGVQGAPGPGSTPIYLNRTVTTSSSVSGYLPATCPANTRVVTGFVRQAPGMAIHEAGHEYVDPSLNALMVEIASPTDGTPRSLTVQVVCLQ